MMHRRELLRMTGALAGAAAAGGLRSRVQRPLPKSEFDYVDWSWDRWRDITDAHRPSLQTPQTGRADLVELVDAGNPTPTAGVRTFKSGARTWEDRRRAIHDVLTEFVGEPPPRPAPLEARTVQEVDEGTYVRRHVELRAGTGEWIPSVLLVPRHVMRGRAPAAAVLCPHQTTQEGRREPAGLAGNPEQATARRLAERGFVTFTWDALCFGERHDPASGHYGDAIPFYTAYPRWSLLGKMVADLSRAVDYLSSLDFVDSARIACMGHSHGGITTIFGMALEPRLAAGASNCGFDTFRIDGNVWRWSHATALLPRLGFYVSSPYLTMDFYRGVPDSEVIQVPFDLHEVLALAAPRPLLLSTSDDDFVFPNAGWSARCAAVRLALLYEALGAGDRLRFEYFRGGHRLPAAVASVIDEWLHKVLQAA